MYKIIIVALISSFEIYAAIGSGLAFGLSPHYIFLATLVGGISGVFVFAFLGDKISEFLNKYRKPKEKKETTKDKLLIILRNKYGLFGVGFIGTFLVGAPISISIGTGLGIQIKQLISYCLVAVVIKNLF